MLRELTIRNLAVLEEAKVAFAAGLNVLTGETGAGKSIVIDALLLVRGARVQADLIRTGAETASVEAVFEVPPTGPRAAVLDAAREGARKEELYRWELSEIDAVQLRDGEEDELRGERRRLQNAERIYAGLQEVMDLLQEDAQAAGARLGRAVSLLRELSRFDPAVGAPTEALKGPQAYVEDAETPPRTLRDRAARDPDRLPLFDTLLHPISPPPRNH